MDHTSEEQFKAYGKSLEEAFANAGLAMTNIMVDVDEVKKVKSIEIKVESDKLESLLYDFLDEILFIRDVDNIFISEFKDLKISENKDSYVLTATCMGDDILNYETAGDVKAPTYDEMKIVENDEWVVEAVVDV